jgi:hypothetical protein
MSTSSLVTALIEWRLTAGFVVDFVQSYGNVVSDVAGLVV